MIRRMIKPYIRAKTENGKIGPDDLSSKQWLSISQKPEKICKEWIPADLTFAAMTSVQTFFALGRLFVWFF